ncbi:MAG: acyl-CoA thioesterase [Acidimicrobiales bacterium]
MAASSAAHRTDVKVRFCELDPYGHVNHSIYVQYFEVGRVEALHSVGMGLDVLQREFDMTIVVTQIATRFHRSAMLADTLTIESGLSEVGRVKATWLQRVVRGDEVIATQKMVSGSLSTAGKPVRFPSRLVEALEIYRVETDWLRQ